MPKIPTVLVILLAIFVGYWIKNSGPQATANVIGDFIQGTSDVFSALVDRFTDS